MILIGVNVNKLDNHTYTFKADSVNVEFFNLPEVKQKEGNLRGSILIIGPLLARFGIGYISSPGGDKIGRRRLDTHFIGFEKLGARFTFDANDNCYKVDARTCRDLYSYG